MENNSNLAQAFFLDDQMLRPFNLNNLLEKIQQFVFQKTKSTGSIQLNSALSHDSYYFYQIKQVFNINNKLINQSLSQFKKILGREIIDKFHQICSQINQNHLQNTYLKYLYGIFKIPSLQKTYITRILIWIYSLCYGTYEKQSCILKSTLQNHSKLLTTLGLQILSTQQEKVYKKINKFPTYSIEKLQKNFKKYMVDFIKDQQQKNHQQAYQICRICQSHISLNLMQAHLAICETIFQKNYLILKIQQIGRQFLQKIKIDKIQYDFLDSRADTKLFFDRVYSNLGQKNVIFQIKQDQSEICEVIDQFQDNSNILIYQCVQLLQKYHENITIKAKISGYESEDNFRISQKSKIKSTKYLSKASIKLSSNSLTPQQSSKNSSFGSQTQIRIIDDSNHNLSFKTSKTFYSLQDFDIIKLLGKGAYSQVYLVRNINTSDYFAMKVVEVQSVDHQTLEALKKQQQIYKTISSEFAVKLYYSFSQENLHFFLLEYANGGNLRNLLAEEVYIEEEHAKLYLANIILALQEIHQMKIVHRDLKPQNIVIDEQGFLKLTDFNLAYMLKMSEQQKQSNSINFFGSPDYIAPEVIKSELKDHPSRDIWSLGIIAYEILIGVTPFTDMQVQKVFENIIKGQIQWPEEDNQQQGISEQAKDLIIKLLQPIPEKRLGFHGLDQVKKHNFFNTINWKNLHMHKTFYVPTKQNQNLQGNIKLKQKILQRKSVTSLNFPSLGCIIRYDALKNKSSMKAKSARKSRFKLQKQLNELKQLTSMNKIASSRFSGKHLYSSHLLHRSNSSSEESAIEMKQVSNKKIEIQQHDEIRHDQQKQNIDINAHIKKINNMDIN